MALAWSLCAGTAGGLRAQTPFTAAGLGFPVPTVDARAAALGGARVGLLGGTFSLGNPAELMEHALAGISISAAPEAVNIDGPAVTENTGRSRFSVVRALTPIGKWAVGFGFGSVLDQDWTLRFRDTLRIPLGSFPFEESREHDGGVSSIDLSIARRIGALSVGIAGQRLTGALRKDFTRRFDPSMIGTGPAITGASDEQRLTYRGWRIKGGVSLKWGDSFLVGGDFSVPTNLTVIEQDSLLEQINSREIDMPKEAEVGASYRVSRRILVAASAGWQGWSALDGELEGTTAQDVYWGGAGVELGGLRFLGADLPVRLGVRHTDLPFAPLSAAQPSETAATGGLGLVFRDGLAAMEMAAEIGSRGNLKDTGLEESFRRFTLTFTIRSR